MLNTKIIYERLTDFNEISEYDGFNKNWVYKDALDAERFGNCWQKIAFSIYDINKIIDRINETKRILYNDVICMIVYTDWIITGAHLIKDLFNNLISHFEYSNITELQKKHSFFRALRSFVIAHPLNTTNHADYGFDGEYICVDYMENNTSIWERYESYHLSFDGLKRQASYKNDDIILKVYSSKKPSFFRIISLKLNDLLECSREYIFMLKELNKFLLKAKKKDYK